MLKQIILVSLFLGCVVGLPTFIYHTPELDDMNSLSFYNFYIFTQKYGKVYNN